MQAEGLLLRHMSDPILPLQQSLAARDQFLRKRSLDSTPAERLAAMQKILDSARYLLEQNPQGRLHFLQRNYRARSIRNSSQQECHDT
jgi:hypothetical protein